MDGTCRSIYKSARPSHPCGNLEKMYSELLSWTKAATPTLHLALKQMQFTQFSPHRLKPHKPLYTVAERAGEAGWRERGY